MLVFYKERLAFLSVPKTGSTAYQTALAARADMVVSDPPELKHASLYRFDRFFRPMFAKVCHVELETLAVVREPVSWLGSWFRYRQRPFLAGKPNSTQGISFDQFVLDYLKGDKPAHANVGSQAKFLKPHPKAGPVTYLFRYEDPGQLDDFLFQRIGLRPETQRKNVSPERPLELSGNTERRLRNKCAEEFALYDSIG